MRVIQAAAEVVGLMAKTMPSELWERQQRLDERLTRVRSPEGAITASIAAMTDAEVAAAAAEMQAIAAAVPRG
jgi:hypothetical protein